MKTRREFLTRSGIVLSSLFVPALARACGRKRRQVYEPCPPIAPSPTVRSAPEEHFVDGMQRCGYACPRDFYGQIGPLYYYLCLCCPTNTCCINASSSAYYLNLPYPCGDDGCIQLTGGGGGFESKHRVAGPPECGGQEFFPSKGHQEHGMRDKNTGNPIFLKKADDFLNPMGSHGEKKAERLVRYDHPGNPSKTIFAKVFDVEIVQGSLTFRLKVGGQLETDPGSTEAFESIKPGNGHHHQIRKADEECYHVILAKGQA